MGLHLAGRFHLSAIFMPHTFQAALNTLSTYIFLQGHHFQKHNLHLKEEIEVTSPPRLYKQEPLRIPQILPEQS